MKKIFGTSKTVALNAVTILTSLITYIGYATGFLHFLLPAQLVAILVTVNVILSEILNYYFPSGQFVGTGLNLTPIKLILTLATTTLAFLQAGDVVNLIPQGALIPIVAGIQLLIRILGGATPAQQQAAHSS